MRDLPYCTNRGPGLYRLHLELGHIRRMLCGRLSLGLTRRWTLGPLLVYCPVNYVLCG
jgi:hypothetical protein